ncbi:LPS export ABC transporter periplasmic protein LptC [Candidatus Poribacteria bacterium]|nr:LPS export ABC transporter periplasmic protein LptC [Candidatus Poribacteria bacterium]
MVYRYPELTLIRNGRMEELVLREAKEWKNGRFINIDTVILLFLTIFFFAAGCGRGDEQVTTAESEKITQEIRTFTMQNTKAGEPKWTLVADVARYLESGQIRVEKPNVTIFQEGQETMTITGDSGEIEQNREDFRIIGNPVKGVSKKGIIYTTELYWKDESEKLYAPGEVKITRGDSVMFGKEMESNPKLEIVTLKKVHFTIYPKDEKINETKD